MTSSVVCFSFPSNPSCLAFSPFLLPPFSVSLPPFSFLFPSSNNCPYDDIDREPNPTTRYIVTPANYKSCNIIQASGQHAETLLYLTGLVVQHLEHVTGASFSVRYKSHSHRFGGERKKKERSLKDMVFCS